MHDSWLSGDPYEYYMGRWSKLIATEFIDWLSPRSGLRWLDVGCGSGALSEAIMERSNPSSVIAVDQSEGFISTTRQRLGSKVTCKVGDASLLPLDNAIVDVTVSGLMLNFLPEPAKALAQMQRVTRTGGTVAVYIWDYAGEMEFIKHFWDAAVALNPDAARLHESNRFPDSNAEWLTGTFRRADFSDIMSTPLDIITHFHNFDDYWKPFLGGQGPVPTYVSSLNVEDRGSLKAALGRMLPINQDGSITLHARAWAVKGTV